ncbi:3-methyladenine DNA glycosylase 2 [Zoogloea sp.]|uniref:DNA-3-methyladenine glycosylase family protein n=1 Tax=Zoogloea sp. TaxID=49181 RepID=UPI001416557F|nr:MAG: DNA-3-methyladenine glycosylase 2 family protein [Zoogloea sp.]
MSTTAGLTCITLPLPPGYRQADFLAFHARDRQGLAEQVAGSTLHKGLIWQGAPARLEVGFGDSTASLRIGPAGTLGCSGLAAWGRRFLGLDQPVEAFEAAWHSHPLLGPHLARRPGLRLSQAASPFEALSWAITGQQISVAAALGIRRRLIEATALHTRDGLACYPDAPAVAALSEAQLRAAGFSRSKAATLLEIARQVGDGQLPLDDWWAQGAAPALIRERLLALRGIGPWTVDYTLLRGFGYLDASLHGDAAVRRGLGQLLGGEGDAACPDPRSTEAWLAPFTPWRSLVAAHLWQIQA